MGQDIDIREAGSNPPQTQDTAGQSSCTAGDNFLLLMYGMARIAARRIIEKGCLFSFFSMKQESGKIRFAGDLY